MTQSFLATYGNPDADGDGILDLKWASDNLAIFNLPFPMRLSWEPKTTIKRFQAHRLAGPRIIAALTSIVRYSGYPDLVSHNLDLWGGCFNFRLIRGGSSLSMHSWGTAVDINPDIGRLGSLEDAKTYPVFIRTAFEDEGFCWGGLWARPDAMHFELED